MSSLRDRVSWAGAIFVLIVGTMTWLLGQPSLGLTIDRQPDGRYVVSDVTVGSLAWAAGASPGLTVERINGDRPVTGPVFGIGAELQVVDASGNRRAITLDAPERWLSMPALWLACGLLAAAWLWRATVARDPVVASVAMPVSWRPSHRSLSCRPSAFGSPVALIAGAVLWPVGLVPLAGAIIGRLDGRSRLLAAALAGIGLAGAGVLALPLLEPGPASDVVTLRELLVVLALLGPVGLVARVRLATAGGWSASSAPVLEILVLLAAAATPIVVHGALAAPSVVGALVAIVLWLVAGVLVTRLVVVPLTALVSRVVRQRDLVAAAADAERRRIGADLHDGPLQSLTLLAYRLDATGDEDNAALARDVATELRAVSSSLRLPVVDDLGLGPGLEWLTAQIGRLTGTRIELERVDDGRPPLDVEHAGFRIAQEALANATRHGRPPIRVHYEASGTRAELTVDDAGPGVTADAGALAGERGFGVLGMTERASAVGADLEFGPSPNGSRVRFTWPARR